MPLPPRVRHAVQEHNRRSRRVAGFHVVPRDGFTVARRCDEPVHYRRIAELLAFTVGVGPRWAGLGELIEESLDALKEVLRSAADR